MREITIKTLINFLPLPADYKLELLETYDSLSKEVQLSISETLWEAFYDEYDFQIKISFDQAVAEAEKSGKKTDKSLYQEALNNARDEIEKRLASAGESVDLSAARKSMEQIVREINAVKGQIKPTNAKAS